MLFGLKNCIEKFLQNRNTEPYLMIQIQQFRLKNYTTVIFLKTKRVKEEDFASKFEKNEDVKLYIKLPNWFKIPTPIGNYNPDWAILLDVDGTDKLYFVLETKSGKNSQLFEEPLRESEKINIECGRKHFEALNTKAEFKTANEFDKFMQEVIR